MRYNPLSSVLCFAILKLASNAPVSNRAPYPVPDGFLDGTPYKGKGPVYFCLWPMLVPLYFGQAVLYVNILEQDSDAALQGLGPGYARWGTANANSCKASNDINLVFDRLSTDQRKSCLAPSGTEWKLAEGGNCMTFEDVNAADFTDYTQHAATSAPSFSLPRPSGRQVSPATKSRFAPPRTMRRTQLQGPARPDPSSTSLALTLIG